MTPGSFHRVLASTVVALSIAFALASARPAAQASPAPASSVKSCELGTLRLESGQSIDRFRMTYITLGTLNASRSNAVLQIHGLRGNRNTMTPWAGPDQAFDTNKYFVIQPDTLGVATLDPYATTSPTRSGLKMQFPRFNIRDMVQAEYRMLTECLGLSHLVAVAGSSMGGIESMQWAVSYPRFMDAVIPIVPQALTAKQSVFIWEAARRTIMLDPKWRNGDYPESDPPKDGVGVGLAIQTAFGSSSLGFDQDFPSRTAVIESYDANVKAAGSGVDARDWVYRTYAIDAHNIAETPTAGGSLAAAAKLIQARLLMFPNCYDQLLPPVASGVYDVAEHAPFAKVVNVNEVHGHGGPERQRARITTEIRSLLARIERGAPGIEGPRFPPGSTRADCSGGATASDRVVEASRLAQRSSQSGVAASRAEFLKVIERPRAALSPSPSTLSVEGGYAQELVSFVSEPGETVPLLILKKGARRDRQPVVIALHGTGGSKAGMRGMLQRYADLGFIGVAMDARHHGERALPIPGLPNSYQSAMLRAFRTGHGHPYLYDTVWDVMRLLDYLSTRPDVDPKRIGVVGNSKGGTEAYLAAAADERIAVAVPLIGVQSFSWSLRHPSGWEARTWTLRAATEAAAAEAHENVNAAFVRKFYDRIAPGLVDTFDGPAMLPLIAPRPLMVVNGDSDPRSPLGGVREAIAAAEGAYAAADATEKFSFVLEVGAAHEVTPEADAAVRQWLVRWLSPSANKN